MTRTRPGSLTLLAVLNFVGAGFGLLGCLGQVVGLFVMRHAEAGLAHQTPMWWMILALVGSVLSVGLLVVSGIGMLKLSPLLGRWGATAYAVLAVLLAVGGHLMVMHTTGDAAPPVLMSLLGTVISLLYPLFLVLWVHLIVVDVWYPPIIRAATGSANREVVHPVLLTLGQSLRQTLRGVSGPSFILGLFMTGLLTCFSVLAVATFAGEALPMVSGGRGGLIERGTTTIIGFITGEQAGTTDAMSDAMSGPVTETASQRWATHLVVDHPPILSFTWLILSFILPVAVVFASSGLIARDTSSRGFRFLLTRIDRTSLFLGRFASAAVLTTVVIVLLVASCATLVCLARPEIGVGAAASWSAWAAIALIIISLPYLALGMLASTLIGHSFAALSAAQGLVLGWPLFALSLSAVWAPLKHAIHLLPVAVQFFLFHPSPMMVSLAMLGCLAYTALFLWLGCAYFRVRDL